MKLNDGYVSYIINPKAGPGSNKTVVQRFRQYLQSKGLKLTVRLTTSLRHAYELAADAAVDYDCAMVVVAGGDGTVREVAHGLEGSDKPMLIVPCGTENLLANELGLDEKLNSVIKAFEKGVLKALDLGSANDKCFTSIVGFGFDGDVVKRVSDKRIGHINHLDYFWPIWKTFWDYNFAPIKVEMDGEKIFDGCGLVFVGNISRYALGLQILHYADFSDGLLDVCIYKCDSRVKLIKYSALTVLKRHADKPGVIYRQGKNICVTSDDENMKTEIDGDPGPALPMQIAIIPDAVKVIVPKDARPAGIRARLLRIIK